MMIRSILLNLVLVLCSSLALAEQSETSIKEMIMGQFPQGESLTAESLLLTQGQIAMLKKESAIPMESGLFRYFIVKKGHEILGIALIDTHMVRTKTESLLFLFAADGKLEAIEILAFKEPEKYKPTSDQIAAAVAVQGASKGVALKTGATLTSYALERSRRRAFALLSIIQGKL